jgi:branched-chain amino acid aminotransferase
MSVNEPDAQSSAMPLDQSVGYFNHKWVSRDSIRISIDDLGFRSGVTAVERLRTYCGNVFELDSHLTRLSRTLHSLSITGLPGSDEMAGLVHELLKRNAQWLASQQNHDCGITIFATPGEWGAGIATLGLHVNPIDHGRVERFRTFGQPLLISDVTQQPASTWPRDIKVRSRLHYHMADTHAKQVDRDAVAILVDSDGSVTETSIANLAIVCDGEIYSPLLEQVLGGVTQSVVERLAKSSGWTWHHRRLSPQQVRRAEEVLLMGTDNGLWFANQIDDATICGAGTSEVFRDLSRAFDALTRAGR